VQAAVASTASEHSDRRIVEVARARMRCPTQRCSRPHRTARHPRRTVPGRDRAHHRRHRIPTRRPHPRCTHPPRLATRTTAQAVEALHLILERQLGTLRPIRIMTETHDVAHHVIHVVVLLDLPIQQGPCARSDDRARRPTHMLHRGTYESLFVIELLVSTLHRSAPPVGRAVNRPSSTAASKSMGPARSPNTDAQSRRHPGCTERMASTDHVPPPSRHRGR
jgi:hypothetical protein